MSFGLTCAPGVFVTAMNQIFSGEAFRAGKATAYLEGTTREERAKQIANDPEMAALAENLFDECVVIYIDDIIISSKTEEDHVKHVKKVLERLRAYQLYLKADKCVFGKDEVEYLGHKITPKGISVCEDKVEAIKNWPHPTTVGEIRQFLGLGGFYRRFIKGYSQIAKPLTDLTQKDKSDIKSGKLHEYPTEARDAFEKLKDLLCSAPVLKIPELQKGAST